MGKSTISIYGHVYQRVAIHKSLDQSGIDQQLVTLLKLYKVPAPPQWWNVGL